MADRETIIVLQRDIIVLQRELQQAEVERLRLLGELDAMLEQRYALREGLVAAVELLDCSMGAPCRPDLDDKVRAVIAKAEAAP